MDYNYNNGGFDIVQDAVNVSNANTQILRNRVDAMKARQQFQFLKRQELAANDARGQFDPVSGTFVPRQVAPPVQIPQNVAPGGPGSGSVIPPGAGQPVTPTAQVQASQNRPPMVQQTSIPGPAVAAPAPGGQMPAPGVQPAPVMSEEDRAAIRGEKKMQSISGRVQAMLPQAVNDPTMRIKINQMAAQHEKDPDHQAMMAKMGYDEMSFSVDPDTGKGISTLTKNYTSEELQNFADNAPNGEMLRPFVSNPGKYRLQFQENGGIVGAQFIPSEKLGKKTREELIDLSLHGTPEERKKARENLAEDARLKKESASASAAGGTGLSADAIEMEAERVVAGEKVGNYGYGKQGAAMRAEVINRAAKIAKSRGLDASDIIAQGAELAGEKGGMKDLVKRETLIGSYVKRIDATSDLLMKQAKEIGNTDSRLLNIPRNQLAKFIGSGKYRAYQLSLYSLSREIGKVETGQLGISAVTDSQAKIMDAIHDENLSIKDLQDLIDGGKALGKTSMDSVRSQRKDLKNEIAGHPAVQVEPSGDDPLGLR